MKCQENWQESQHQWEEGSKQNDPCVHGELKHYVQVIFPRRVDIYIVLDTGSGATDSTASVLHIICFCLFV
jgi:hypothetical protein